MKRFLFSLFVAYAVAAFGQPQVQLFEQGNQLYQQGKFAEAASMYEKIVSEGYASGELYFNLGNAYYKAGNISKAILNYERARKLIPNDEDLQHNLALANMMITDRIEPLPRLFLWEWWDGLLSFFSLSGATWLAYGFYLLFLGTIAIIITSRSYDARRLAAIVSAVMFLCLLGSATILAGKIKDARRTDTAIITANVATVKNSPDAKSSDAFVLHSGVKIYLTDKVNNWYKIRLADGKVGWVEAEMLEII